MGKFLIGFVVGAAVGGAVIYVLSQREQGATASGNGVQAGGGSSMVQQVNARIQQALAAARDAASESETRLWDEFRQKLPPNPSGTSGNEPGLPGAAPA